MDIPTLTSLTEPEFVTLLGGVYEVSPWVAQAVCSEGPFTSLSGLRAALRRRVDESGHAAQLTLLRAHPELAARARMSPDSVGEQRGAGLDQLTPEEHAQLLRLNAAYREKFGFPFILAVKGKDKNDIRAGLKERLENGPKEEFSKALSEVHAIAGFRLDALFPAQEVL